MPKKDIENVLLMIGIDQYYPLANFETNYFKIMIEKSKELLNSLYSKVLQYELPAENNIQKDNFRGFSSAGKSGILIDNIMPFQSKSKGHRPNYFGSDLNKPLLNLSVKNNQISEKEKERKKIGYFILFSIFLFLQLLDNRTAELMYNIEKIRSYFDEPDFIQLKFLAQYENDPLV